MINLIRFFTYIFDSCFFRINNDLSSGDSDFVLKIENQLFSKEKYVKNIIFLNNVFKDKHTEYPTREKLFIKNKTFFAVLITIDSKVIYFD